MTKVKIVVSYKLICSASNLMDPLHEFKKKDIELENRGKIYKKLWCLILTFNQPLLSEQ